jgi:predicted nucleotidyltransferase
MSIAAGIELSAAGIAAICRRHQVKELSLFGSAVRGEMRPDSASSLPCSAAVDLAVKPALKPLIRPGVLAEARLIYGPPPGVSVFPLGNVPIAAIQAPALPGR